MIRNMTIVQLQAAIEQSNRVSAQGAQRYVYHEQDILNSDYEFIDCPCNENCWCKANGCTGHFRIRDILFKDFLDSYARLWIPPKSRKAIISAVLNGTPFAGRQHNAIRYLQWLKNNWVAVLGVVRQYDKCGLCDDGVSGIYHSISITNLYEAKMWSQLYYDTLVPFDTGSRNRIKQHGYTDPMVDYAQMNREMYSCLRVIGAGNNLNVSGIRALDRPWAVTSDILPNANGQPLSRVLDKVFYSP